MTRDGTEYALPELHAWELRYTGGVPCDSFSLRCAYGAEMAAALGQASRFYAREGEKTAFYGVIDEWRALCGENGLTLSVAGRGMAALLLDNESEPAVYGRATTEEILRRHVLPYGVVCAGYDALTLGNYTVESGGSEWRALSGFTERAGGFLPYFEPDGRLTLRADRPGRTLSFDGARITEISYRGRRYGVLSEAVVIDRKTRARTAVRDDDFCARGGSCRRVRYVPNGTDRRAEGEAMLRRSREGKETMTVTVAGRFEACAGDRAHLSGSILGVTGMFRAAEVVRRMDGAGETTVLTLERE